MNNVIYVIVRKSDGHYVKGSGSRSVLAYTTEGRARAAMKTHMMSDVKYEVAEFTPKEDE
ncbi:hypothetical protein [Sporosarcina sp. ITBMC105]